MSYLRWAFTALAFPIAGWLAVQVAGEAVGPLSAAITGAVAGALIGAAQWAALGRLAGWRWVIATALGLGAGCARVPPDRRFDHCRSARADRTVTESARRSRSGHRTAARPANRAVGPSAWRSPGRSDGSSRRSSSPRVPAGSSSSASAGPSS